MVISPRPSAAALLAGSVLLAGCGWPRYSNLPDDTDVIDAADDPRSTVPVDFETRTEASLAPSGADNADPRNVETVSLAPLAGVEVTGDLRGIGWNETFEAPVLEGEGCTSSSHATGRAGDWAGDVDFVVIEVTESGVLCADAAFDQAELGWDLLLYPLDPTNCDLPEPPLSGPEGEPLGFGLGGPAAGWKTRIEPGLYGVLLAGYASPDPLATYPYALGVSVVPPGDGRELCPRLPSQGSPP